LNSELKKSQPQACRVETQKVNGKKVNMHHSDRTILAVHCSSDSYDYYRIYGDDGGGDVSNTEIVDDSVNWWRRLSNTNEANAAGDKIALLCVATTPANFIAT
jgi:hypothetical protein